MATKGLKQLLQDDKEKHLNHIKDLIEKVNAINILLGSSKRLTTREVDAEGNIVNGEDFQANNIVAEHAAIYNRTFPPKGAYSWKEYLFNALVHLGGKAKTGDIAELIVYSNRDISYNRARQAGADKLPELVAEGRVSSDNNPSRKVGNTYSIVE